MTEQQDKNQSRSDQPQPGSITSDLRGDQPADSILKERDANGHHIVPCKVKTWRCRHHLELGACRECVTAALGEDYR